RGPRPALGTAERQRKQKADDADDHEPGARPVDLVLSPVVRHHAQDVVDDDHGEDREWHVDVEDPAPAGRTELCEVAANQRTGNARQTEYGAEHAHVAASIARRYDIGDDRERERHEAAGAETLDTTEQDELGHVL